MAYKQNIVTYNQPSTSPPTNPKIGDIWWQTNGGKYCRYVASGQWVCTENLKGGDAFYVWPGGTYAPNPKSIDYVSFPFQGSIATGLYASSDWPVYGPFGGHNSTNMAYIVNNAPAGYNSINLQKWPFAFKGASVLSLQTYTTNFAPSNTATNSSSFGYITGGNSAAGTPSSSIVKNNFAFDTLSISGTLTGGARSYTPAGHNCSTFGFSIGGGGASSATAYSFIDQISYAADGNSTKTANLTVVKSYLVGFNSSIAGYTCGGWNGSASSSTIEKQSFPGAGSSAVVSNLVAANYHTSNGMNSSTEGYIAGGYTAAALSYIQRLNFALDTAVVNIIGNLSGSTSLANQCIDNTDFVSMFV